MSYFLQVMKLYLKDKRFWISILLYLFFILFRAYQEISLFKGGPTERIGIYYFFGNMYNVGGVKIILLLASSFVVVSIFVNDWKSARILNILTRESILRYSFVIVIASALISLLIPLISNLIYILILSFKFEMFPKAIEKAVLEQNARVFIGGELMSKNNPMYYVLLDFIHSAIFSFYCMFSVMVSVVLTDYYLISVMPIVLYTFVGNALSEIPALFLIRAQNVFSGTTIINEGLKYYLGKTLTKSGEIIYPVAYYLIMLILFAMITYFLLKRRIRKEKSFGGGIYNE